MKDPRVKTWGVFHVLLCDAVIFLYITVCTQNLVYLVLSHILLLLFHFGSFPLVKLQREAGLQRIEIEKQRKEIERQDKVIDKYKYINSTNSNMPSSFDVLSHTKAKASTNTRVPTNRKRGGQKYHKLRKSQIKADADSIIYKKVVKVPYGAKAIRDEKDSIVYYVTHEVDLILKSKIIETRYYISEDGEVLDDKTMKKYAINPLTYSNHFKATVVYLNQRGTIPLQRLNEMMADIKKENTLEKLDEIFSNYRSLLYRIKTIFYFNGE